MYLGILAIDDYLTFYVNTHDPSDGSASDADSVPTYRIYEDETTPAIVTSSMALLDSANTTGLYSERVQLTAASGFEVGKCYAIYILATVGGVTGTISHTFQIMDLATKAEVADSVWDEAKAGHTAGGSFGEEVQAHSLSTEIAALNDPSDTEIADAVLSRDVDNVETTAPVHSLATAILRLASRVDASGGANILIYRTNGVTIHATLSIDDSDAAAAIITEQGVAT